MPQEHGGGPPGRQDGDIPAHTQDDRHPAAAPRGDAPGSDEILAALNRVAARLDRVEDDIERLSGMVAGSHRAPGGNGGRSPEDEGEAPALIERAALGRRSRAQLDEEKGRAAAAATAHEEAPPPRRREMRTWPLLLALVVATVAAVGGYWIFAGGADEAPPQQQTAEAPPPEGGPPAADGEDAAQEDGGADDTGATAGRAAGDEAPADETPADETDVAAERPDGPEAGPDMPALAPPPVEVTELGEGLAPLPDDAPPELRELARAAADGNTDAQHDLAVRYALGEGMPQNFDRAAFWFGLAAEAGDANAQYNLGVLTRRGQGVPQDEPAAFELFRAAAEAGHPDAQFAVGLAYRDGRGVERDPVRAAQWLESAAANDRPRAAFHLGRLYEEGLEGPPDLDAAAEWYEVAAAAGVEDAEAALERVREQQQAATEAAEEAGDAAPPPEAAPTPTAPDETFGETLSRDQLREVQRLLNELDHEAGPVDGLMGDRTESAIRSFQQANDLTVDGEADLTLLRRLRDALRNR